MQGLRVESGRVVQLSGGVTSTGDALTGEIATMTGTLDDLRVGWQSSTAAPKFVQVMETHLEQATLLKDALLSHGASLTTAAGSYDEAEAAIAGPVAVV